MKCQATFSDNQEKWEESFKASTDSRAIKKARKLVREHRKEYRNQDTLSCWLDRIDTGERKICIKAF